MFALIRSAATSTDIWLLNNECYGATQTNPFKHNVARNILGRGNRVSRSIALIGVITLDADAATVVANANIVDATTTDQIAFVVLTPLNSQAALLVGSAKSPYISTITAGTNFTIAVPGNAAGTEIFAYEIIQ